MNDLIHTAFMAKYSAHDGMKNPKDSLSIELSVEDVRMLINKWGMNKFRVGPTPTWDGIRIYPRGTHGFSYNPNDNRGIRGRATIRLTEDNNQWLKNIPAFGIAESQMLIHEKYFDIMIPQVLRPPIKRTSRRPIPVTPGSLVTRPTEEIVYAERQEDEPKSTAVTKMQVVGTPSSFKSGKIELFDLIDKINGIKDQYGDAMLFSVTDKGFIKVMVEHGN